MDFIRQLLFIAYNKGLGYADIFTATSKNNYHYIMKFLIQCLCYEYCCVYTENMDYSKLRNQLFNFFYCLLFFHSDEQESIVNSFILYRCFYLEEIFDAFIKISKEAISEFQIQDIDIDAVVKNLEKQSLTVINNNFIDLVDNDQSQEVEKVFKYSHCFLFDKTMVITMFYYLDTSNIKKILFFLKEDDSVLSKIKSWFLNNETIENTEVFSSETFHHDNIFKYESNITLEGTLYDEESFLHYMLDMLVEHIHRTNDVFYIFCELQRVFGNYPLYERFFIAAVSDEQYALVNKIYYSNIVDASSSSYLAYFLDANNNDVNSLAQLIDFISEEPDIAEDSSETSLSYFCINT